MHYSLLVVGDDIESQLEPFLDWDEDDGNPQAAFDWYVIGGRFANGLRLRKPRQTASGDYEVNVSQAKKCEITGDELLATPPFAVLFRDDWLQSEFDESPQAQQAWRAEFARAFAQIADDATLTIVDCHLY